MYYAKSTAGFYDPAIHATMPEDAIEISADEHAELMDAQAAGAIIEADSDGRPVAVEPPPLTGKPLIMSQIADLESSVSPRRIREAVLGADNGWLQSVNDKIAALRAQLK